MRMRTEDDTSCASRKEYCKVLEVLDKEMDQESQKEFEWALERKLERMYDYYFEICKLVSLKMFDYGVKYGRGE